MSKQRKLTDFHMVTTTPAADEPLKIKIPAKNTSSSNNNTALETENSISLFDQAIKSIGTQRTFSNKELQQLHSELQGMLANIQGERNAAAKKLEDLEVAQQAKIAKAAAAAAMDVKKENVQIDKQQDKEEEYDDNVKMEDAIVPILPATQDVSASLDLQTPSKQIRVADSFLATPVSPKFNHTQNATQDTQNLLDHHHPIMPPATPSMVLIDETTSAQVDIMQTPTHVVATPAKKKSASSSTNKKKRKRQVVDDEDDEEYDPSAEQAAPEEEEELEDEMDVEDDGHGNTVAGDAQSQQAKKKAAKARARKNGQAAVAQQLEANMELMETEMSPPASPVTPAATKKKNTTTKKKGSAAQRRRRKVNPAETDDFIFESDDERMAGIQGVGYQSFWNFMNSMFVPVPSNSRRLQLLEAKEPKEATDDAFQIPPIGRSYLEVWAEEADQDESFMDAGFSNYGARGNTRRPNASNQMDTDDAEDRPSFDIETASDAYESHTLAQRLLSALIEESSLSNSNDAKDKKKGRPSTTKSIKDAMPSISYEDGPFQSDIRTSITDEYNFTVMQAVNDKVLNELRVTGILERDDSLELDRREDDEICAELRSLQRELKSQILLNNQRKAEILESVKPHFEAEAKREQLEIQYREGEQKWKDLHANRKKKKAS